jgi:hypothetical protein
MKPYDIWISDIKCNGKYTVALPPLHYSESDFVYFSGSKKEIVEKIKDWKELATEVRNATI